ncbi:hypothetical protein C8J57DRAFT_1240655 [Mycena rebaudengoi]|nr:hypothetical protein C8J57DRAFT_1240655 [Mycena rebaudengoi]
MFFGTQVELWEYIFFDRHWALLHSCWQISSSATMVAKAGSHYLEFCLSLQDKFPSKAEQLVKKNVSLIDTIQMTRGLKTNIQRSGAHTNLPVDAAPAQRLWIEGPLQSETVGLSSKDFDGSVWKDTRGQILLNLHIVQNILDKDLAFLELAVVLCYMTASAGACQHCPHSSNWPTYDDKKVQLRHKNNMRCLILAYMTSTASNNKLLTIGPEIRQLTGDWLPMAWLWLKPACNSSAVASNSSTILLFQCWSSNMFYIIMKPSVWKDMDKDKLQLMQ